jgi:hypothetical protein
VDKCGTAGASNLDAKPDASFALSNQVGAKLKGPFVGVYHARSRWWKDWPRLEAGPLQCLTNSSGDATLLEIGSCVQHIDCFISSSFSYTFFFLKLYPYILDAYELQKVRRNFPFCPLTLSQQKGMHAFNSWRGGLLCSEVLNSSSSVKNVTGCYPYSAFFFSATNTWAGGPHSMTSA